MNMMKNDGMLDGAEASPKRGCHGAPHAFIITTLF